MEPLITQPTESLLDIEDIMSSDYTVSKDSASILKDGAPIDYRLAIAISLTLRNETIRRSKILEKLRVDRSNMASTRLFSDEGVS